MKLNKSDKRNLIKKAQVAALGQMSERKPPVEAIRRFRTKAYETADVSKYLKKRGEANESGKEKEERGEEEIS